MTGRVLSTWLALPSLEALVTDGTTGEVPQGTRQGAQGRGRRKGRGSV